MSGHDVQYGYKVRHVADGTCAMRDEYGHIRWVDRQHGSVFDIDAATEIVGRVPGTTLEQAAAVR